MAHPEDDHGLPLPRDPWDEPEATRLARNFNELLQELRVTQTGVQILFAFLLTFALFPGFDDLGTWSLVLYFLTLAMTVIAMALLVAPVAVHRAVFRRNYKPVVVLVAHRLTLAGLAFLLLAVSGGVSLATSVALGAAWSLVFGAGAGLVLVGAWVVLPLEVRRRAQR